MPTVVRRPICNALAFSVGAAANGSASMVTASPNSETVEAPQSRLKSRPRRGGCWLDAEVGFPDGRVLLQVGGLAAQRYPAVLHHIAAIGGLQGDQDVLLHQ